MTKSLKNQPGMCSLCGAHGTNKSTCPLNPQAKNPNPLKHKIQAPSKRSAINPSPVRISGGNNSRAVLITLINGRNEFLDPDKITASIRQQIINAYIKLLARNPRIINVSVDMDEDLLLVKYDLKSSNIRVNNSEIDNPAGLEEIVINGYAIFPNYDPL